MEFHIHVHFIMLRWDCVEAIVAYSALLTKLFEITIHSEDEIIRRKILFFYLVRLYRRKLYLAHPERQPMAKKGIKRHLIQSKGTSLSKTTA